jgi:hypothetical protein
LKEKSVRMFPYGGYDPFTAPPSKGYASSQSLPDRPPYAQAAHVPMQQQYAQAFSQPIMPYMMPMMPPGMAPPPMMPGMPFHPKQGPGNQGTMPMFETQGSGLNFGKVMGGANQFMGLAQQMGNIFSLFK